MIILASQSPRRKEILKEILDDVPFVCIPSSFDERKVHEDDVRKLCLEEARGKGLAVAKDHQEDIVISSDTMVSFKGEQLGKPKDHDDARFACFVNYPVRHMKLSLLILSSKGKKNCAIVS